ncbi:protein Shroom1 [Paroedura picta]|uniref:protein Shroom1 n=1 Tax=Paroedura picta TaxID=143630 RepID=UPI004055D95E
MSSCGNEVSRWNLRHVTRIIDVLEPVTSPSYANKLSSGAPTDGIDQCLHTSGKADSAYSSFSGGFNIPECHIPLGDSGHDILPIEQLPYMDSGYVRGVFNPCAIHSNLKEIYQDKPVEMSMHNNMDNGKPYGSTSVPGTLYQSPSPVVMLPPHLPRTSPPPAQDNYKASRNTDQSHYGICFNYNIQAEEFSQEAINTHPFDSSGKSYCWLSRCKNKSPVMELEDSDIWYPTNQYAAKKNETAVFIKPYLNFQDYLKSGSLVHTLNSAHNYKILEALNSRSSLSPHTSHNAVNDIQENKQCLYACSVHKPPFAEADLPCTMPVSGEQGQLCHVFNADQHSGLDQEICESNPSLKYVDSSLQTALGIISTYEDKNYCFSSREENSTNAGQPLLKQQARRQKLPPAYQILNGLRKAKQSENNGSPELLTKPKQPEMLTSVRSPQQFSKRVESQSQDDSANRKINRKTTPLLYYLSGEKNTNSMSNPNQAQLQEDFDMQLPRSDRAVSAEPIEIPRDSNSCVSDSAASKKTELILGSPASSADEKLKNDYREKLKVAQRKVLRETSFKRRDLQMSLPIRLKQKPSSKPSILHLRSLSLSSTNEDSKPLENTSKQEEPTKPQASVTGGRKRITKEQKKISYSEPEKLNQLDDQRDHNIALRKKTAGSRSDEINEHVPMIINGKGLENQGRALSKVELKQIQQNALLQYMERKTGQRPATAHPSALQLPPLQMRPSNSKKFSEDSMSNLSSSKKSQYIDGSSPFYDLGRNLEAPALLSSTTSLSPASDRGSSSPSEYEKVNWKMQPAVSEGSCVRRCTSTKNLLYSDASVSSKGHGRSKSTPSPMQDSCKSTACPALSSQNHQYAFQSSFSASSKEELEADPSDCFRTTQQNSYTAGRRGKSMEETGTSEIVRLLPLSQSTDQLYHLKNWQISSGQKPDKDRKRSNNQNNILQNYEPTSGSLPRPSHPEGVAGLKGLNVMVQALEQSPNTNKHCNTFINLGNPTLCPVPTLSGGGSQSQSVPLEPLHSSPAPFPAETDNDVFKDSFPDGSENASSLPFSYKQNKNSILDRTLLEPALTTSVLQASIEGKQNKDYNASFYIPKKEEPSLGNGNGNNEENISAENSHCLEMAPEFSGFILKKRMGKDPQLQKEISIHSQMSDASGRILWPQLPVAHRRAGYCLEGMAYCTSISDSQEDKNTGHPSAKVKQNEQDHIFQEQDTKLSTVQLNIQEKQRCEDLAVKIIAKDKSLVDILRPHPIRKTALDLMEGLFPVNVSISDRSLRIKRRNQSVLENDQINCDSASDLYHETGHFIEQRADNSTSHIDQTLSSGRVCLEDAENVISKKKELISHILLKLQALWDEKELLQSEAQEHSVQGKELESLVQDLCKPNEYERYMMFIGDLEKVVSLLLCLSSRLARVQNAMEKIDESTDAEEKQSLNERHSLLSRQREDAKDLKENLDRRERVVSGILSKYLTEGQLQDYRHFVQAKTSLLIEQKDLEEQIKFLEEQLERLWESIPP